MSSKILNSPISLKQLRAKGLPSTLNEVKGKGRLLGFAPTSEPDTPLRKWGYHKLVEDAKRQFDDAKLTTPLPPFFKGDECGSPPGTGQEGGEGSRSEQRAAVILEEAKEQSEKIKDEAFKKGYQEGFTQGKEAGKIKVKEESGAIVKFFQNAVEEVSSLKSSILKEMEPEIVQLSLQLAEKLVLDSLRMHPEAIATIVKNLIKNVEDEEEIKILVNPSALPILEEYLQQFLEIIKSESKLKIEGDEKISEGGCLIVTDTKILDAQIETRILEAASGLMIDD